MNNRFKVSVSSLSVLLVLCASCVLPLAKGQSLSDKPLNVVIPFAPGGGTDVLTRMVMPKVAEKLGVSIVIENRPGLPARLVLSLSRGRIPTAKRSWSALFPRSALTLASTQNYPITLSGILWH